MLGKVGEASAHPGFKTNPSLSTNRRTHPVLTQDKEVEKGGRCARERAGTGAEEPGGGKGMVEGVESSDSRHREKQSRACEDVDCGVEGRGEWRRAISASKGKAYWFNPVTGESRWELQLEPELPKPVQQLLPGDKLGRAPGGCKRAGGAHAGERRASKTAKINDSTLKMPPTSLGREPEKVTGPAASEAEARLQQPLMSAELP